MPDKKDRHIARVEEKVEFADGKVRSIKPLTIKSLREFVKIINGLELSSADTMDDETINKMVDAALIVLKQTDSSVTKEMVEEALDLDTFQKLMTVAMGSRLFDPNQTEAEV